MQMKGIKLLLLILINNTAVADIVSIDRGVKLKIPTLEQFAKNTKKPSQKRQEKQHQTTQTSERQVRNGGVKWISVAVLFKFLLAFKSFGSPFFDPLGEPRRATESSIYFTFIAVLYVWLASVTTLTILPHVSTHYNVITAAALFFYMGFISVCTLLAGRFLIRCAYYVLLLWKRGMIQAEFVSSPKLKTLELTKKQLPVLVHWYRPFRRVCKSSWIISAVLCSFYTHCWSRSLTAFKVYRVDGASFLCQGIFTPLLWLGFSSKISGMEQAHSTCADEFSIWVIWAAVILGHLFYYLINEFNGLHHKGCTTAQKKPKSVLDHISVLKISKSGSSMDDGFGDEEDDDDEHKERDSWPSISAALQNFKLERPQGTLPMVSWYSQIVFSTGFDLLLSFHVFLGRFDARKMQSALIGKESKCNHKLCEHSTSPEGLFDFSECSEMDDSGFWFDFMSDCGDGFNSSYQIARLLAQPSLNVYTPSSSKTNGSMKTLPRGKLLVIGGDLAYPDPTPASK